jgi:hypothetical protein
MARAAARTAGQIKQRATTKEARVSAVRKTAVNTSTMAAAEQVDPNKPLTEKQCLFVKFMAEGDTPQNAYQRAGYSIADVSYAYRMAKMPNILKALAVEREAYARASELTKKDVMDMLKESYDMAKLLSEPASMVSAAREIGKMAGFYEPKKIEVSLKDGRRKVQAMSDEELFAAIEAMNNDPALLALEHEEEGDHA